MMWTWLIAAASAGPFRPDEVHGRLDFSRDAAGVAAAVGEILPTLQACLDAAPGARTRLLRLQFEIDIDGVPGPVEPLWAPEDAVLATCLAAPLADLRFQDGKQPLPVEIPVSIRVEEEHRTEVRSPR